MKKTKKQKMTCHQKLVQLLERGEFGKAITIQNVT